MPPYNAPQQQNIPSSVVDTVIAGGNIQRVSTYVQTQYFTPAQYQALLAQQQAQVASITAQVTAMTPIATQASAAVTAATTAVGASTAAPAA